MENLESQTPAPESVPNKDFIKLVLWFQIAPFVLRAIALVPNNLPNEMSWFIFVSWPAQLLYFFSIPAAFLASIAYVLVNIRFIYKSITPFAVATFLAFVFITFVVSMWSGVIEVPSLTFH